MAKVGIDGGRVFSTADKGYGSHSACVFRCVFPGFLVQVRYLPFVATERHLKQLLSENSNILQFQSLFTVVHNDKSDAMRKYVYRWDATRDRVAEYDPQSRLAAVKPYILADGAVYESLGWFK